LGRRVLDMAMKMAVRVEILEQALGV